MKAALLDKLRTLRSFTTLIVLFVGGGSIYILPYLSSYFYIPMKDAMHLSNMQIGLMGSAMGFTSMVFYWPEAGWRIASRHESLISMVAYTPDVFVPALAGHLLDRYAAGGAGYRYFFLILAVFSIAGIGLTLLFRHRISVRDRAHI